MWRVFFYEAAPFLILFAVYALWLVARGTNPLHPDAWAEAPLVVLVAAATVATFVGIGIFVRLDSAPAGSVYVPAHLEDGKLVPPRMEPAPGPP